MIISSPISYLGILPEFYDPNPQSRGPQAGALVLSLLSNNNCRGFIIRVTMQEFGRGYLCLLPK